MKKLKRISALFSLFMIVFIIILPVSVFSEEQGDIQPDDTALDSSVLEEITYSRAKILRVLSEEDSQVDYSGGSIKSNIQVVEALVVKGRHRGEKVIADCDMYFGAGDKYNSMKLEPGDEVFLFFEENEDGTVEKAYVAEIARDKYLLYLIIGFLVMLLLIGRLKGLKAIISLLLTVIGIWKVLLPAILNGWDPVLVSVGLCIIVICFTMLIISGFNKKTFAAVIGTVGGVLVAGIIALIIGTMAKLTGFGDDDSQMLLYIPQNIQLNFRGLLFAGIIIGTMGATMDVGMSIASAMHEIAGHRDRYLKSGHRDRSLVPEPS